MNKFLQWSLFFSALVFYAAFNAKLPITDPVEANYALTVKEMILSNDLLSPRIYGRYWFDKPIMIYWLIALSYKVFGINEFAARFPSVLFSAGSVSLIFWFAQKLYSNQKIAVFSVLVLSTSLEYWILSKMIITDAVLFFFNSLTLVAIYLGIHDGSKRWRFAAYIAAALAVLTKGPVGIVLPGFIILSYIAFTRKWFWLKRLMLFRGMLLFFLVAAPWYVLMYRQHGQQFIETFLGLHNYLRATVSEHPEDNVFYYYLVLFPLSLLPWTGILLHSFRSIFKEVRLPHVAYLTVWIAITLFFYTLMATKYLTYVFPALFPAALWIGYHMKGMCDNPGRWKWLWLTVPVIGLLVLFAAAGPVLLNQMVGILSIFSATAVLILIWLQCRGKVHYLPWAAGLAVMIVSLSLVSTALVPMANERSAKELVKNIPAENAMVASYGDYSTSAVFYSGYTIPTLNEKDMERDDVWAGKYTMPMESFDNFMKRTQTEPEVYVLVSGDQQNLFDQMGLYQSFQPVSSYGKMTLYKKMILR